MRLNRENQYGFCCVLVHWCVVHGLAVSCGSAFQNLACGWFLYVTLCGRAFHIRSWTIANSCKVSLHRASCCTVNLLSRLECPQISSSVIQWATDWHFFYENNNFNLRMYNWIRLCLHYCNGFVWCSFCRVCRRTQWSKIFSLHSCSIPLRFVQSNSQQFGVCWWNVWWSDSTDSAYLSSELRTKFASYRQRNGATSEFRDCVARSGAKKGILDLQRNNVFVSPSAAEAEL